MKIEITISVLYIINWIDGYIKENDWIQGVASDKLRIIGTTQLNIKLGKLQITHPVLIVNYIAHKSNFGNDLNSVQMRYTQFLASNRVWNRVYALQAT